MRRIKKPPAFPSEFTALFISRTLRAQLPPMKVAGGHG
jgi:hypothetical protein